MMVNNLIIENLLQQDEGVRLEFKRIVSLNTIATNITAFINTNGGDLLIGVDDDKNVVGVDDAYEQCNSIQKFLVNKIHPTAPLSVQVLEYKNKSLILVSVWEGAKKPYQFENKIYSRIGSNTNAVSVSGLTNLIEDRASADYNWERMPVLGAELKELSLAEVKRTMQSYATFKPAAVFEDEEDFLYQLGLIQNGNITNAAIVLFGKNPTKYILQSKIRLTVYPGKVSGNEFKDDRIYDGSIFSNIEKILTYFENFFGKSISVQGVLRTEKINFPLVAFREGLLNAIVHRDYNSINGFLQISIYSDRTEFSNYGSLPDGITTRDLRTEHSSILRNPDIAQVCFYNKYIEMLGSGTLRMIAECKRHGFKAPKWESKNDITKVIFEGIGDGVNDGVNSKNDGVNAVDDDGVNDGVKILIDGVNDGVNKGLNLVLDYLRKSPNQKTPEVAVAINKSIPTTERYLKILRDQNLIVYIGPPKTGGYIIKK